MLVLLFKEKMLSFPSKNSITSWGYAYVKAEENTTSDSTTKEKQSWQSTVVLETIIYKAMVAFWACSLRGCLKSLVGRKKAHSV
jgi:hypothetical protein